MNTFGTITECDKCVRTYPCQRKGYCVASAFFDACERVLVAGSGNKPDLYWPAKRLSDICADVVGGQQ